eukprot:309149-Lingulodinium_polyedra.AAC.1
MRSNRPSAAATARASHASRTPRERQLRGLHGTRACDLRAAVAGDCIIAWVALTSCDYLDCMDYIIAWIFVALIALDCTD